LVSSGVRIDRRLAVASAVGGDDPDPDVAASELVDQRRGGRPGLDQRDGAVSGGDQTLVQVDPQLDPEREVDRDPDDKQQHRDQPEHAQGHPAAQRRRRRAHGRVRNT
jgi:hypothetical protein